MATDLCEGAFHPNFAKKMTEKYESCIVCQSFRIDVKAVKRLGKVFRFMYFPEK